MLMHIGKRDIDGDSWKDAGPCQPPPQPTPSHTPNLPFPLNPLQAEEKCLAVTDLASMLRAPGGLV